MKISNYGELISFVTGKPLITYREFGSYQGEYLVALDDGENIEIWKGYYGSCSGCDWLEDKRYSGTDEVSEADAREYLKEEHPFATIKKITLQNINADTFEKMLPANIRTQVNEFEPAAFFAEITEYLSKK